MNFAFLKGLGLLTVNRIGLGPEAAQQRRPTIRPVLSSAGKDAFHSVPLFPRGHALAFYALSGDPSSHLQEVRDAVGMRPYQVHGTDSRPFPQANASGLWPSMQAAAQRNARPENYATQRWFMTSIGLSKCWAVFCSLFLVFSQALAEETKPVSYFKEIVPILKRSCTGCHHPGKLKGQLDLTTYAALQKGGKHGAALKPGDPKASLLLEEITGDEPSMPKEGDPLTKQEILLIERWIADGANDDTPVNARSRKLTEPPSYPVAPVISTLAYSPDGNLLAISGYHEVLLHKSDGSGLIDRLVGESPRIESLVFSPNGKLLAVAGSAPSEFGEVQVWSTSEAKQMKSFKVSLDSVYGISFSPDAERIAFGAADKSLRMISTADGKELLKFDNHSDWVLATAFTVDGKRLLSGSRDKAMKLIDASNGQFIDDVNKLLDEVVCMARHPKVDQAAYGGELGGVRLYKISDNQGRTAANNDVNLVREFERQPGRVHAIAFSPDGNLLAVGGVAKEIRVYKTSDGSRAATLKGHEGAVFALQFHPTRNELASGGYDGKVRIFDTISGNVITSFIPVPITETKQVAGKAK
jgi:dipeptidyl aminopeptidase/acylaminoacyl peptidase